MDCMDLVRDLEDAVAALAVCAKIDGLPAGWGVIVEDQIRKLETVVEKIERQRCVKVAR